MLNRGKKSFNQFTCWMLLSKNPQESHQSADTGGKMAAGRQVAAASFTQREEETSAAPPPAVHDGRCPVGICRSCCFPPGSSGGPVMVERRRAGRCASHNRYGAAETPLSPNFSRFASRLPPPVSAIAPACQLAC